MSADRRPRQLSQTTLDTLLAAALHDNQELRGARKGSNVIDSPGPGLRSIGENTTIKTTYDNNLAGSHICRST